ncbi:TrbI/VirB10 family protein [Aestuariispira insulae]|uniref:Type IV secretory pathway VirB10-like protein n=1 Tax=Aestuariispira insulae TaxID=1461337 RepID=A0A3D9H3Q2_9PROT|nr:TrbI/VirB10 family protein [Aestuariispira insulae]RED44115.1 type IV secretory pathway VirB10-like protein [Aestuariispira insulae]
MYSAKQSLIALPLAVLLTGCFEDQQDSSKQSEEPPKIVITTPEDYYPKFVKPEPKPPVPGSLILPDKIDFGESFVSDKVLTRRFTISIDGETPVLLNGIDNSGPATLFPDHDCPDKITPGTSCTVSLTLYADEPMDITNRILISTNRELYKVAVAGILKTKVQKPKLPEPPLPKPVPQEPPAPQEIDPILMMMLLDSLSDEELAALQAEFGITNPPSDIGSVEASPPTYVMSDENYLREGTPSIETSYPVNRESILTMDRPIWAVNDRRIISTLEGLVFAHIDEIVMGTDGVTQILEPGDVAIGRYKPLEKQGDDRLDVCFFRIIRLSDGAHLYGSNSGSEECFAYATDAEGKVGLPGQIDNRMWERYGGAFVTSGISALAALGQASFDDEGIADESAQSLSDNLGQITAKMLEENIDLAPIIKIAAGERMGIQLLRDIYIRRPKLEEG